VITLPKKVDHLKESINMPPTNRFVCTKSRSLSQKQSPILPDKVDHVSENSRLSCPKSTIIRPKKVDHFHRKSPSLFPEDSITLLKTSKELCLKEKITLTKDQTLPKAVCTLINVSKIVDGIAQEVDHFPKNSRSLCPKKSITYHKIAHYFAQKVHPSAGNSRHFAWKKSQSLRSKKSITSTKKKRSVCSKGRPRFKKS
jgi:hypothetical protein